MLLVVWHEVVSENYKRIVSDESAKGYSEGYKSQFRTFHGALSGIISRTVHALRLVEKIEPGVPDSSSLKAVCQIVIFFNMDRELLAITVVVS